MANYRLDDRSYTSLGIGVQVDSQIGPKYRWGGLRLYSSFRLPGHSDLYGVLE